MKSILDPSFKYVSSVATDVRKTFARVRRELRQRERQVLRAAKQTGSGQVAKTGESRPVLVGPRRALAAA